MAFNEKKFGAFKDQDSTRMNLERPVIDNHNPHAVNYISGSASGSNTLSIDRFRQGINLLGNTRLESLATIFTTRIKIQQPFGQTFNLEYGPFKESEGFITGSTVGHLESNDSNITYLDLNDRDVYLNDAAIEPLVIRDEVFFDSTFIDIPNTVKASIQAAEDNFRAACLIEQRVPLNNTLHEQRLLMFEDSQEVFHNSTLATPGPITETRLSIRPFDENFADTFYDKITGELHNIAVSMSLNPSGTRVQQSILKRNDTISANAGFEFFSARIAAGTDSIAFGDVQEYHAKGFLSLKDSLVETYPGIKRGNTNRSLGKLSSSFDDTNITIFSDNVSIIAGRNLCPGTKLSSSIIFQEDPNMSMTTSSITVRFSGAVTNGNTIELFDGNMNQRLFELRANGTTSATGRINACSGAINLPDSAHKFRDAINAEFTGSSFGISASLNAASKTGTALDEVILHQLVSGTAGNTEITFTLVSNVKVGTTAGNGSSQTAYFAGGKTTSFKTGSIIYPYVGQFRQVVQGKSVSGLTVTGNALSGTADKQYIRNADPYLLKGPGEGTISPFVDSKINFLTSSFYMTGTNPELLPNFSAKLSDKSIIQINIDPTETTRVFFSTGSSQFVANTGFAYYNFDLKRWEIHGDTSDKSNFDVYDSDTDIRHSGLRAFVPADIPGTVIATGDKTAILARAVGSIQSNFGFPYANTYDATGSQLLKMSDYIDHPFLVEKIVYELSASIGPHTVSNTQFGPQIKSIFLINQFENSSKPETITQTIDNYVGSSSMTATHTTGKKREIISWGQIGIEPTAVTGGWPDEYVRDHQFYLTYFLNQSSTQTSIFRHSGTGSIRIEVEPRSPAINHGIGRNSFYVRDRHEADVSSGDDYGELAHNHLGGRDGLGNASGRSFLASVVGSEVIGDVIKTTLAASADAVSVVSGTHSVSPYLLMPSDKLIVGFENTPSIGLAGQYGVKPDETDHTQRNELGVAISEIQLCPGLGKITLYGSYVRDNKEFHDVYNQDLVSDAIHEDLHELHLDQYDVEPAVVFSGSYIDDVFDGDIFAGTRRKVSSIASGQAGLTASLLRGVSLNTNERFFDTMLGNPADYHVANQSQIFQSGSLISITVGDPNKTYTPATEAIDTTWPRAFPFESRYSNVKRLVTIKSFADKSINTLASTGDALGKKNPIHVFYSGSVDAGDYLIGTGPNVKMTNNSARSNILKFYFGTGDNVGNLPNILPGKASLFAANPVNIGKPELRGFKYGVLNTERQTSRQIYRYDQYGQFRDMLEQRLYSRFFVEKPAVKGITKGFQLEPVLIRFVNSEGTDIDPLKTNCSNIDIYATSSLPFFDDVSGRNRDFDAETIGTETVEV